MTPTWTVLVVDDDAGYRALLQRHLQKRGHRVVEAATGREGMKIASGDGIDAIVVDGLLPDTDGLRWLAELRGRGIRTPAIFASSFFKDIETHRRLTRDMRVAAVLQKPVTDLGTFVAEVVRALFSAMGVTPPEPVVRANRGPAPMPVVARGTNAGRLPVNAVAPGVAPRRPDPAPATTRPPSPRIQEIGDAIEELLREKPPK
jgi:CheY-like chemotaxis protein